MRTSISLTTVLSLALVAPLAMVTAHSPNVNNDCNGQDFGDAALVGASGFYVSGDVQVWEESNGIPGLQLHRHTCTDKTTDENGDRTCGNRNQPACEIITFEADTRIA